MAPTTLAGKIWDRHVIERGDSDLLYIDLHLLHELTSPQAFEGLRMAGRAVRRPDLAVATADHNVPTSAEGLSLLDGLSARQLRIQRDNCCQAGIELHPLGSPGQGIVHVIGPELGLTQPGMTIVCGDSHTATLGAFGAIAFGIGTSQVEHVLATQTLWAPRPRTMAVTVRGTPRPGTTAKDLTLAIIARIGTAGGAGTLIEYRGEAIAALPMEGRMTVCNMAIEAGARSGMIAPDETTFAYLEQRERSPRGRLWERALDDWRTLRTDDGAVFDREAVIDAASIGPQASWGTNPAQTTGIDGTVPAPESFADPVERAAAERALAYMDLAPGTAMRDIGISTVFIGSCTNGRLADLRAAAGVLRGRRIAPGVRALVVPGSTRVKQSAEEEGLDEVFRAAGFEWRSSGCSMCVGMNGDAVEPGGRSASTSNRNFEGRQGPGARTHLVSPESAAASAVLGHLASAADLREH
ncbi:3-isopropylmalate dehydratase large subunit [Actinomadura bangladeshensis]|uniref:3-isopropylmalate dehydratase large subunit n=1 Tax=Actinomadura bangladeshensis TaxID=453573 RepID=A0A6L9QWQ3_9ACTN|nr:3-isopropylmalate dehydratase large subunit [Actinomadura bangladeshensis]NEA29949.1 3-isopropylmalate dehydratase large subunit [Actinomadura bangladeshensis]